MRSVPARPLSRSRTRCCLPRWGNALSSNKEKGKRKKGQGNPEGWEGWDAYAPFYDWENARTLGRRDVPFWRTLARQGGGRVLELGCGTGRIALPLARAGAMVVGIDRSAPMLERARQRSRRAKLHGRVHLVRG